MDVDRHRHKDKERKREKRERHEDSEGKHKRKRRKEKETIVRVVDDNEDEWVEKNIDLDGDKVRTTSFNRFSLMYITQPLATDIPTAESLKLTSRAYPTSDDPPLPKVVLTESSLKRDDWMLEPPVGSSASPVVRDPRLEGGNESLTEDYGEQATGARTLGGGIDFFSNLGKERERKPKPDVPNPDKVFLLFYSLPLCSHFYHPVTCQLERAKHAT